MTHDFPAIKSSGQSPTRVAEVVVQPEELVRRDACGADIGLKDLCFHVGACSVGCLQH